MGCGASLPVNEQTKAIDKEIRDAEHRSKRELKLLLLGTGGSGKSTIAKQMKVIHLNGFTESECALYAEFVVLNILSGFKAVVRAMEELELEPQAENAGTCNLLRQMTVRHGAVEMTPQLGKELIALWADPAAKEAWDRSSKARAEEACEYFFDHLGRCCAAGYVPTLDDVLHVRIKTTGIKEIAFAYSGFTFRVVDVGGQRSERRKWIHCFQDVTAVLFVVALSDYDLMMEEDPTMNRLHESLDLFRKVVNNTFFVNVDIILFLNKKDLFKKKIERVALTECFRDFPAETAHDYEAGVKFISQKFKEANEAKSRRLFLHETAATDTNNVEKVWKAIHDVIVMDHSAEAGFELQ